MKVVEATVIAIWWAARDAASRRAASAVATLKSATSSVIWSAAGIPRSRSLLTLPHSTPSGSGKSALGPRRS